MNEIAEGRRECKQGTHSGRVKRFHEEHMGFAEFDLLKHSSANRLAADATR